MKKYGSLIWGAYYVQTPISVAKYGFLIGLFLCVSGCIAPKPLVYKLINGDYVAARLVKTEAQIPFAKNANKNDAKWICRDQKKRLSIEKIEVNERKNNSIAVSLIFRCT